MEIEVDGSHNVSRLRHVFERLNKVKKDSIKKESRKTILCDKIFQIYSSYELLAETLVMMEEEDLCCALCAFHTTEPVESEKESQAEKSKESSQSEDLDANNQPDANDCCQYEISEILDSLKRQDETVVAEEVFVQLTFNFENLEGVFASR